MPKHLARTDPPEAAQPPTAPGVWQVAARDPGRTALIVPGSDPVTFGALAAAANRLSNVLRGLGIDTGDAVASLQHNSPEHYEVNLAAMQIGGSFVPVNVRLTAAEIGYIVRDSGAKALIASSDLARSLDSVADRLPQRRYAVGDPVPGWESYASLKAAAPDTPPRAGGSAAG
jgi:long-chain acyl-CoA synthetase